MMKKYLSLFAFVALCLAVGAGAGFLTAQSVMTWFPTLVKPWFNPPSWLFAPVWTTLYIMMAVAAWLVWLRKGSLVLFYVQLALNFAWSLLFFGLHSPAMALVDIAAMWVAILLTLLGFWKVDRRAGWLMVPYLAWVSFASLLNASIWWLN
jgi:translocator protein